jgi:iron complex outermembrane receptor protein
MRNILLPLLLLCTTSVWANEEASGSIKGKVTTSDNRSAAYVSIILSPGNRGIVTDDNGEFSFLRIKPGSYS